MKWRQSADRQVVEAVVRALGTRPEGLQLQLLAITSSQWQRSCHWLDVSGTALYLLDRLEDLELVAALPHATYARLQTNLLDNKERTRSIYKELLQLNQAFQREGIDYCNLKGFTLYPHSCPDLTLRTQLDIDFLVDGAHLELCGKILRESGYVLHAVTNSVWEFKTQSDEIASIADLYKTREQRTVELHFSSGEQPSRDPRLDRLDWQEIGTTPFPSLSPVDQFLSQATHIFAHLCGPSTRLSWLFEFANHIAFRAEDAAFWDQIVESAAADNDILIAVGVACLTVQELFNTPLPLSLRASIINRTPRAIELWTTTYAVCSVLADFPGTKLHLLLREHLPHDERSSTFIRQSLVPTRRPPRIIHLRPNATPWTRLKGELLQLRYELFRLRFHITEGVSLLREMPRWRRLVHQHRSSPQSDGDLLSSAVQSQ